MAFDADPSVEVTTRDRLVRLRDFLATLPDEQFDMREPGGSAFEGVCGSAACIGGWARCLFTPDGGIYIGLSEVGTTYLHLSPEQAADQFYPALTEAMNAAPTQAVRVLDHLIATGEVDWSVAFEAAPNSPDLSTQQRGAA